MSKDSAGLSCRCTKPKRVTVVEDHFLGLFIDEPVYTVEWEYCDRCGLSMGRSR